MPTALKRRMTETDNEIPREPVRERTITPRETEVLRLAALGYKNREIADQLGIRVKTVETHRANIMNKLALRNVAQLVRYAIQKGLVSVEIE
jgi:two-component system response regulator NreC